MKLVQNKQFEYLNSEIEELKIKVHILNEANQHLENVIGELGYENNKLKKELEEDKLETSKEKYEKYLRSKNPLGVIVGDKFYILKQSFKDIDCPYCNGTTKITTQTGLEMVCPCYDGKKRVSAGYEVKEVKCIAISRLIGEKYYYFSNFDGAGYTYYKDEGYTYTKAFPTREEAEQYIKELEK